VVGEVDAHAASATMRGGMYVVGCEAHLAMIPAMARFPVTVSPRRGLSNPSKATKALQRHSGCLEERAVLVIDVAGCIIGMDVRG
jgi:hypothetical protein